MMTRRGLLVAMTAAGRPAHRAVVMRARDGVVLRAEGEQGDARAPGSAVKPLLVDALGAERAMVCKRELRIGAHRLDCTHIPQLLPVSGETALAASCNWWFAEMARRADARAIERRLLESGAAARRAGTPEALQLQVLGLEGVRFTAPALAQAYRRLALRGSGPVLRGMMRCVTEGTAYAAAVEGLMVAGKTGTTREGAWFAGFAPVAEARVVVAVYVPGGKGATDAAPLAREYFEWWRKNS